MLVPPAIGWIEAHVALRQSHVGMALTEDLVIAPGIWGLAAQFLLHVHAGYGGALLAGVVTLSLVVKLALHRLKAMWVPPRLADVTP